LREGDILFSIAGALGRSTIVQSSWLPANTNQAFAVIRLSRRSQIHPRYLLWVLRSDAIQARISEINVQAAQANLSLEQVRDFEVVVLEPENQRRIASMLDDADELIAALECLIAKKEAIKGGTMQELLTGRTRLTGFSGPWVSMDVASRSTIQARIGWQGLTRSEYRSSGTYRLVGGTEFRNGRVAWEATPYVDKRRYEQDRGIQLRRGDVLLTKDGTIGKTAYVDELPGPSTLNSGVFVIRPVRESYDSLLLYYMLRSRAFDDFLLRLTAGSTISHLYQRDLLGLALKMPPTITEQRAIAELLADSDRDLEQLRMRLKKAYAIKQGMMRELLTGRTRLPVVEETVAA
jgi:type I restriction enzyme S subunit